MPNREWNRTGPIGQPTLFLYGKDDSLESEESYEELLKEDHPGPISVVGYKGATRKFDELGGLRTKNHPAIGSFSKAFHQGSFEDSVIKVHEFLGENFKQ